SAPAASAPTTYATAVVALARDQYDRYHEFTEGDAPLSDQIRTYWEDLGLDFPGVGTPWSAVFVSWVMRRAGASASEFRASTSHWGFVFWAIKNELAQQGLFRAHRLDVYRPAVGDILHNNRNHQTLTYDFASQHEAYESHSAIVVEVVVDAAGPFLRTIG